MFPEINRTKAPRMPRAKMCYICGRQTLIAGFDHHVVQCRKLFEQREATKPKNERRSVPMDPAMMVGRNCSIQDYNDTAQAAYTSTLSQCRNCGRKFLPDKLLIHSRSCTASNPARRIDENVNRRTLGTAVQSCEGFAKTSNLLPTSGSRGREERLIQTMPKLSSHDQRNMSYEYGESADFVPAALMQCADCGRSFNPEAYQKHVNVCRKVFIQKRKTFDSSAKRLPDEAKQLNRFQSKSSRNSSAKPSKTRLDASSGVGGGTVKSNWRQQCSEFRNIIKMNRKVTFAEKKSKETGIPLHQLLPPSGETFGRDAAENSSFIPCPHCGRTYNEQAANRHIPKCKDIYAKPSRLKAHSGSVATTYTYKR